MIESIEKLRGYAPHHPELYAVCNAAADEIEAEIAERYIELPVDADGVPIRIGDLVTHPFFEGSREVRSLTKEQRNPYWHLGVDGGKVTAHTCRHAKLRTIEDVLHDFAKDVLSMNRNRFAESPDEIHIPDGAKYADELREMMGGDDG